MPTPAQEPPAGEEQRETAAPDAAARVMALSQELMRRMVALAGELTTSSGLNPSDLAALRALDAAAGEGIAVNALGSRLGLSSGAVTTLVDRLERHGLVQRSGHPHDRRKVLVTLAPRAHAFGSQHLLPLARRIQDAATALSPDELAAVERFLRVVVEQDVVEQDVVEQDAVE